MAVVWQYGFFFLAGMVLGVIIGVRIDADTIYKIARIKIKGRGNVVTDLVDVTNPKKESRQSRRQIRRENRHKLDSNE